MWRTIINLTACLLAVATAHAQTPAAPQQWLCVPDQATGFIFDKSSKRWNMTNFGVSGDKYLVTGASGLTFYGNPAKWKVMKIGKTESAAICSSNPDDNFLQCNHLYTTFWLNKRTNRFQYVYSGGYVTSDDDATADTPYIEIGKCSPL